MIDSAGREAILPVSLPVNRELTRFNDLMSLLAARFDHRRQVVFSFLKHWPRMTINGKTVSVKGRYNDMESLTLVSIVTATHCTVQD